MNDFKSKLKLIFSALKFAAEKHREQKRKGSLRIPYINHPIEVAYYLCECCEDPDIDLIVAAILHDTIEDTDTDPEDIKNLFGEDILKLVEEVTDDKSLPKEVRKKLQIETGKKKSKKAKLIKIADKICNVTDLMKTPPTGWSLERKLKYLEWAEKVVNSMRGTNSYLEKIFDRKLKEAYNFYIT